MRKRVEMVVLFLDFRVVHIISAMGCVTQVTIAHITALPPPTKSAPLADMVAYKAK